MSTTLLDLQRRMASAVMQPLTRAMTTPARRSNGTSNARDAEEFLKPNDRLTAVERLQIYNQQYWYRLFGSLEEDYPGVQAVLGRSTFERVLRGYLQDYPSTTFSLAALGAHLPEWLRAHPKLTAPRTRLALDMARLEWAQMEAAEAADLPTLSPQALAELDEDARLRLQPHVRLLQLAYPVDDLLIQINSEPEDRSAVGNSATAARKSHSVRRVAALPPKRLHLAVHRQQFQVYYKRLAVEEFTMLSTLQSGQSLGTALEAAFAKSRLHEQQRAERVQKIFQDWMLLHWLAQPDAEDLNTPRTGAHP